VYVISLITSGLLGNKHDSTEFPLQQWLRERAAMFLYTYIVCLATRSSMISCEPSWLLYCARCNCKFFCYPVTYVHKILRRLFYFTDSLDVHKRKTFI